MAEAFLFLFWAVGAAVTALILYRLLGPDQWAKSWNDPDMGGLGLAFNIVVWPVTLPIILLLEGTVWLAQRRSDHQS